MKTLCHNQLHFERISKEVIAVLEGGQVTSDAGGLLLRELDQRYRLAEMPPSASMILVIPIRLNMTS